MAGGLGYKIVGMHVAYLGAPNARKVRIVHVTFWYIADSQLVDGVLQIQLKVNYT